jgi:hypothetical protein
MDALLLVGLLALSVMAVVTAGTSKWKLVNVASILVCVLAGFGIGAGLEVGGQRMEAGAYIAVPLGIVGALGCWKRNSMRDKPVISANAK